MIKPLLDLVLSVFFIIEKLQAFPSFFVVVVA